MSKISRIAIVMSFLLASCQVEAQIDNTKSQTERITEYRNECSNQISIGFRDTLFSETLDENRELRIYIPRTYVDGRKFPVLYLLDGEYNFESVVGIVRMNIMSKIIPEMMVVAIPNTNRLRDLSTSQNGDYPSATGGAENFIRFIETELMPYVDQNYPTVPYRTIFGHSLGGLVVVKLLLDYPHLFDSYLAIDPSLSWDDQKLLKKAKRVMKDCEFEGKSIYIAIANTLNGTMTYEESLHDTTTASLHLRSILEFCRLAESNDHLSSSWKYYNDETHGSLPIIAEHEAFRFLFSWYKLEQWNGFFTAEPKLSGDEMVAILVTYYEKISKIMRHDFPPKAYDVNSLGYFYLDRGDYERAYSFFELSIKSYPNSANAYDSMGDYYSSVSDTSQAIQYFSKSLELGGAPDTQEKLDKLKLSRD